MDKIDTSGQSMIEYLLLLLVVMTFTFAFLKSDTFNSFFNKDGDFFTRISNSIEINHQFATPKAVMNKSFNDNHESFFNKNSNQSRFFGIKDVYPQQ